jgi:hypothetical protein
MTDRVRASAPAADEQRRGDVRIEILSGRTQDRNLVHIAKTLNEDGSRLREARVVPATSRPKSWRR